MECAELTSLGGPGGDLHSDARAVRDLVSGLDGSVVLLGHSYGGMVVAEAAGGLSNVDRLVYLAAFVPEVGQSFWDIVDPWVAAGADASWIEPAGAGVCRVDPARARGILYNDCGEELAADAQGRLRTQSEASFLQRISAMPGERASSAYILCTKDHAIPLSSQRLMATRAGGETVELRSGHSPFLSQPERLARLLSELCG